MAEKDEKQAAEVPEKGKESPSELKADPTIGEGEEIDSTKLDIDGPGKEATKTEIKVKTGPVLGEDEEKTPVEKLPKSPSLVSQILGFFKKLTSSKKSTTTESDPFEPVSDQLSPYIHLWVAPAHLSAVDKLLFYFSRLLILVGALGIIVLLVQTSLTAYQTSPEVPWILLGATGAMVLLTLLCFLFRWPVYLVLGFPFLALAGLLVYQVLFYPTTDPSFLALLKKSPAELYNYMWMGLLFFELILILFLYPHFKPLKIFLAFLAAYGLAGFVLNKMENIPMEAAWEGAGFFQVLPLIYLQPVYIAIHFFIPLFFLISLVSLFFKTNVGSKGWISMNVILLGLFGVLGFNLLHQNRIPSVLTLVFEEPLGLGAVELKHNGMLLGLKTINFDALKGKDNLDRYRLNLAPYSSSKLKGKQKAQTIFSLSAYNLSGFPVLFLSKMDLSLTANGEPVSIWKIERLKPSDRKDKKGKILKAPHYLLTVDLQKPRPTFDIEIPKEGPTFDSSDSIQFSLKKQSPPVSSFEILVNGKSVMKQKVPPTQRSFTFRLSGLLPGKHKIDIQMTGAEGNTSKKSQEITVLESPGVVIESPMAGDSFSDTLSVYAQIPLSFRKDLERVTFSIDDKEIESKTLPPFSIAMDTRDLPPGNHDLKVTLFRENEEPNSESVSVVKGPHAALSFESPTLGEYLSSETEVKVKVEGDNPYESLELLLNDEKIHEWKASDQQDQNLVYTYNWNTSDLPTGSSILRVRGKTSNKVQSSDWIQVFTGEGKLQIYPPKGTKNKKGALQYKSIVFVLDASISQWDSWDGKSKWEWEKKVLSTFRVQRKLKGTEVGVIVFGSEHPYYKKDCGDYSWIISKEKFNSRKISQLLKKKSPKGVSSLFKAVEEAIKKRPEKVIVITDGSDTCSKELPSKLLTEIQNAKHTVVDVITLGKVGGADNEVLEKLAKSGGGELIAIFLS